MDETNELKRGQRKDPDLFNTVINAFDRSENYIKERKFPENWYKYQKIYENDVWAGTGKARARHLSKVNIPIGFDVVETGLPIATSRTPKPDVKPVLNTNSPAYQAMKMQNAQEAQGVPANPDQPSPFDGYKKECANYAQQMQKQLINDWKNTNMPELNRQMYRSACVYGTAVMKSVWDSRQKKMINTICDIRTIFPTPGITRIKDHVHNPFIYATVMSVDEIKRTYNIEYIEPDAIGDYDATSGTLKYAYGTTTGWSAVMTSAIKSVTSILNKKGDDKPKEEKKDGYCLVIECYMPAEDMDENYEDNDYDEKGARKVDANGNPVKITKTRKKFPNGHKIVTVIKNNPDWILDESPNKYKDGLPPFPEIKNNSQPNDFYGISDMCMIEDLVTRVNMSASNLNDNLRLTGNPIKWEVIGSRVSKPDEDEDTNEIGKVVNVKQKDAMGYLNPPSVGFDIKWWIVEFLMKMIDRVTKLTDAIRGFNSYATDSGKKIRELKLSAAGAFQPKLDAQVQFARDVYEHWAYIHQNLDPRTFIQKNEDEFGEANFEEFIPAKMSEIELEIDVSGDTIMPNDPTAEFEEGLLLFDRGLKRIGTPLISPEHLIDLAPTLEDKTRAKKYLASEQQKDVLMQQLQQEQAMREQANQELIATINSVLQAIDQNSIAVIKTPEFDPLLTKMIAITSQFPELLKGQEFTVLPEQVKLQVLTGIAAGLEDGEE